VSVADCETRLILSAVNLEYRNVTITIYFVPRWVTRLAFRLQFDSIRLSSHDDQPCTHSMSLPAKSRTHISQAEFTHPQTPLRKIVVFFGERGIIPSVDVPFAEAQASNPQLAGAIIGTRRPWRRRRRRFCYSRSGRRYEVR
jgi:hypothetical protein